LDLKRGIFKLDPSDFTISSIKSSSKATKARISLLNNQMIVKSIINALSRHRLIPTDTDATKSKINLNYLAGTPGYNVAE